jgi:hypothetical protein
MFEMGSHDPFGHLKHKLWLIKGPGVKLSINSRPLKVGNRPNFLACKWRATYCLKFFVEGYNFASDLISIGGLHTKLWTPKVPESQLSKFWDFQVLGSPETKCHLAVSLVVRHIVYYKGKGGGFP